MQSLMPFPQTNVMNGAIRLRFYKLTKRVVARLHKHHLDKQAMTRTDASILPPLQKNLLRGELEKKLEDLKARAGLLYGFNERTQRDELLEKVYIGS